MSLNRDCFLLLLCEKFSFVLFSSIQQLPKVWLFFGCRTEVLDLYSDEKQEMVEKKILDRVFLALSREQNVPKVCVIRHCLDVIKILFLEKMFFQRKPSSQNKDKKIPNFTHLS